MRPGTQGPPADEAARLRVALAQTSQEARTPLQLIASLSHLMLRGETDPAQLGRLRAVEQAVRHLGAMVDGLHDLSRADLTQAWPSTALLRPAALLDEVVVMLRPLAQSCGLSLVVAPPAGSLAGAVRGDAAHLRQALLHAGRWVLGVAEAGPVHLQVQVRALPGAALGDGLALRLELCFASRQAGLDAAPDGGTAAPAGGAEAGADDVAADRAALRRLAGQLGGDCGLSAVSPGHWCCWFTAPVQPDATAPGAAVPSADGASASWAGEPDGASTDGLPRSLADRLRQRHAGRHVLVVEDDKVNQMVMLELLGDVGLRADTADDGQEALDRVLGQPYALVAMDLRMPRLDGLGATRALRAMPELGHTPIIAVTANAFDEDRAACRAAGMNDFISKPIDVDRLYAVLLHWLDRSPVGRPDAPVTPGRLTAPSTPPTPAARPAPALAAKAPGAVPAGIDPALMPLLGLEGIDALSGLAAVGGRVVTYRRLLGVFIDAHQGDGQALGQLLHDNEAEAAGRVAHRLRGSAATLGLVDVETAAAGLETAIDRGERGARLAPLFEAVQLALDTTVPALHTALAV